MLIVIDTQSRIKDVSKGDTELRKMLTAACRTLGAGKFNRFLDRFGDDGSETGKEVLEEFRKFLERNPAMTFDHFVSDMAIGTR